LDAEFGSPIIEHGEHDAIPRCQYTHSNLKRED